jgi:uncharacterized protein (DUF983 family)
MQVSVGQIIWRGLRARCPNCGSPSLFKHWLKVNERCRVCGLAFERDEGFFLGAMVINYAAAGLLFIPIIVAAILQIVPVLTAVIVAIAVGIGVPVLFYPASKTLWLMTWYAMFPRDLPANQRGKTDG